MHQGLGTRDGSPNQLFALARAAGEGRGEGPRTRAIHSFLARNSAPPASVVYVFWANPATA
jgi:hypothetical protein